MLDHAPERPATEEDFGILVQGMWAELTDVCGCISAEEVMPNLNEASLTNDFMELDESVYTAPPVQIEVTELKIEKEVMEVF